MNTQNNQYGYSLVELLVAATIAAVAITAIMAVVRTGREIEQSLIHRQQARILITSWMEDSVNEESFSTIITGTRSDSMIINSIMSDTLKGERVAAIVESTIVVDTSSILIKKATVTISWDELWGESDTLSISKWVANTL